MNRRACWKLAKLKPARETEVLNLQRKRARLFMGWLEMECPESDVMLRRDDPPRMRLRGEVRAVIVVRKPVKADGAKDGRKMNA